MKAEEYAKQIESDVNSGKHIADAISEAFFNLQDDIAQTMKIRNPTTPNGVIALINEFEIKWQAVQRRLKASGIWEGPSFTELMKIAKPEVVRNLEILSERLRRR